MRLFHQLNTRRMKWQGQSHCPLEFKIYRLMYYPCPNRFIPQEWSSSLNRAATSIINDDFAWLLLVFHSKGISMPIKLKLIHTWIICGNMSPFFSMKCANLLMLTHREGVTLWFHNHAFICEPLNACLKFLKLFHCPSLLLSSNDDIIITLQSMEMLSSNNI